jgi:hypothetical protein
MPWPEKLMIWSGGLAVIGSTVFMLVAALRRRPFGRLGRWFAGGLVLGSACTFLYAGFEPGFWPPPVAAVLYVLTQLSWGGCCVVGIVLQLREYRTERLVT